jgi:hypothetical protein
MRWLLDDRESCHHSELFCRAMEIYINIRSSSDEHVVTLKAATGSSWADRLQQLEMEGMVDD